MFMLMQPSRPPPDKTVVNRGRVCVFSQWSVDFESDGVTRAGGKNKTRLDDRYLVHTGVHQADFLGSQAVAQINVAAEEKVPFFISLNPVMVHVGSCEGPFASEVNDHAAGISQRFQTNGSDKHVHMCLPRHTPDRNWNTRASRRLSHCSFVGRMITPSTIRR